MSEEMKQRISVKETVNLLKELVDQKRFIDIGVGIEKSLGISKAKLNAAIAELKKQGYKIHRIRLERLGAPEHFLTIRVLGSWDSACSELVKDVSKMVRAIDQKTVKEER